MIIEDHQDPKKPILLINEINEESARKYAENLYRRLKDAPLTDRVVEECHAKISRRWKAWTRLGNTLARKLRRETNYRKFLEYTHGVKL